MWATSGKNRSDVTAYLILTPFKTDGQETLLRGTRQIPVTLLSSLSTIYTEMDSKEQSLLYIIYCIT